ncbi:MAG TPA: GtrA family protein, partial [Acidobacteriota bacterium]|nr:GtrA family protein [Acidobacteriota bacterium]
GACVMVESDLSPRETLKSLGWHWLKFNAVGAVGMALQTLMLEILSHWFGLRSSVAMVIAVELAVIHNFFWHEKWTWSDRPSLTWSDRLLRCVNFNLTNGLVSILGAIVFMELLHERLHLPVQLVNLISIIACSLINFLLSNHLVFRKHLKEE